MKVRVHRKLSESETYTGCVNPLKEVDLSAIYKDGWFFDWKNEFDNPCREVYKLTVLGDIQGLISFKYDEGFVLVNFLESSPDNRHKYGLSVTRPLLAFSCLKSLEVGNDGVICILSKMNPKLIQYYEALGAQYIGNNRLAIFEVESKHLRELYLL
ncbi:hypothetical protein [Bacillus subtilis]|uniref:hypothetical protein n=1 Tax=Lederbergia ruris TaxID=217495 RepID=UPI00177B0E91